MNLFDKIELNDEDDHDEEIFSESGEEDEETFNDFLTPRDEKIQDKEEVEGYNK